MITAIIYNYTKNEPFVASFPMPKEKIEAIKKQGEVMVDSCDCLSLSGVGMSIDEMQTFATTAEEAGLEEFELTLLGRTYTPQEILEVISNDDQFTIVDFSDETAEWSCSDFHSESDKGRVLYDGGWATFAAPVPEELEDYMDYSMLWRDSEINMGIRSVVHEGNGYLIWK